MTMAAFNERAKLVAFYFLTELLQFYSEEENTGDPSDHDRPNRRRR